MPGKSYNDFRLERDKQNFDYINGTIKCLAVDANYTFDPTHTFVDDITNEVENDVGNGYERKTVGGKSIEVPAATNIVRYKANNPTYQAIKTVTDPVALIFYLEVTDDTDSRLMCYNDGVALQTNGSDIEAKLEDGAVLDDVDPNL